MTRESSRLIVGWLLVAVLSLIVYGSLYPFDIRADSFDGGIWRALTLLSWQRAGRADRGSNVLLYLPLGFLLALAYARASHRFLALLLATLTGALISLAIEVTQVYISVRVPSLTDLSLNTAGALLGAVAGLGWRGLHALMRIPQHVENPTRDPSAIVVLGAWLLWRLAPFVPQLDLGQLKAAMRPLIRPHVDPLDVLSYLACWLVINQAISAIVSRQRRLEALLLVIATVLVGQLVIAYQAFAPAELVALLLVLPLIVLMYRMKSRPRRSMLLLAMLGLLLIDGLAPFEFAATPGAWQLWPLQDGALGASWPSLPAVLRALFIYAALLWVARDWSGAMDTAIALALGLVLLIEILQLWQPTYQTSITRPLAVLLLGWLMKRLDRQRRSRGFGRSAIDPAARSR